MLWFTKRLTILLFVNKDINMYHLIAARHLPSQSEVYRNFTRI